ncbi:MAG: undecaprenyldiphospho-muramoylpentapeptide beta-N-acetylglucosaminyltransferase [Chloroflexota bacterium]|nr:undecaprenyldiphospho-muramoylpentapeptide beta-N-acetylglucosaminyltransferase [Chloroflexota bacterium]
MRLLICAGGTGGGVYPAIAVLESLGLNLSSVLWVGSRGGMEKTLVTRKEIPYTSIPAAGVHGVGILKLPGNLLKLFRGYFASLRILRSFQPDALLFTGGYVAFPMAVAAIRKPSLLYVPDIEPGLSLKSLARFADSIALTTEASMSYFSNKSKLTVTGYPVRPGLQEWTREAARDYFNFDPTLPTLAVAGGSKGARSINTAIMNILPELLKEMQVIHISGHLDWEKIEASAKRLTPKQSQRYQVFPFLHEIGAAFAAADLIVSRAGASILGEYPLFGLPAILVPYPFAWRYQKVNAMYLVERGAAEILCDEDLGNQLLSRIQTLINNKNELSRMSKAMAKLATPNAAEKIAILIHEMAGKSQGGVTA